MSCRFGPGRVGRIEARWYSGTSLLLMRKFPNASLPGRMSPDHGAGPPGLF